METSRKWDRASRTYNLATWAEDRRQGDAKRDLFRKACGRCLLVAIGSGNDVKFLPPGLDIVAIDISPAMISKAVPRAAHYDGRMELRLLDVMQLDYPDAYFDTVLTSCTFCSVPGPIRGLREIHRVLREDGRLLMFEHVRSAVPAVGLFLDALTYVSKRFGPDLNRDTVANVRRAGFQVLVERNVYFDIVKAIEARKVRSIDQGVPIHPSAAVRVERT
ncbi:MAG TPA: methyltransferase domain-containing protein [Candidatus Binatia bacterium]|nr:methyltransferase domain-containing protein [Candidatus Binatia bacterium]